MIGKEWVEKIKKADVICSTCLTPWKEPWEDKNWYYEFDGHSFLWIHKCQNAKYEKGFGVPREQLRREKKKGLHSHLEEIEI